MMTQPFSASPHTEAVEAGWREYHAYIEQTRVKLLARPEMQDPAMRAMAQYAIASLVAGGFQFYLAPRQDCPMFYRDAVWTPLVPWGGPASDMTYRWCFLDGRHEYRITGRKGTVLFTDFHLFDGYLGSESMRDLGNYDLDSFEADADGNFEIVASALPHSGNWIRLEPDVSNIAIQMRETWWDWENERGCRIHVERIDDGPRTMLFDETEFLHRLHLAGRLVEQMILRSLGYGKMVRRMAGGENLFSIVVGAESDARDYGASPRAGYASAYWNLARDEALVIEAEVPSARYWSLQLMSPFWDTLDFTWHQSGLNGHQARIDPDGKLRLVISHTDPGYANWLDPLGLAQGQCMFRWYDGPTIALPVAAKVKLEDLAGTMPGNSPRISAADRAQSIRTRSRASLRRWDY